MVIFFDNSKPKKIKYFLKKLIFYIFLILSEIYLIFIFRHYYIIYFYKPRAVIMNVDGASTIQGGGLGNQLFIFSFGYIYAKEFGIKNISINNSNPCSNSREDFTSIDKRCYALDKFGITIPVTYNFSGLSISEKESAFNLSSNLHDFHKDYYDKIIIINNSYLPDYSNNFKKYKKELQKMFVYNQELSPISKKMLQEIKNINNSVSIHIRRGDYIDFGWNYDLSYHIKAAYLLANKILNPNFFIFSDDPEFVREFFKNKNNFNLEKIVFNKVNNKQFNNKKLNKVSIEQIYEKLNNAVYVSEKVKHSLEEFHLMSKCKHNIIPNSTFSWWAAFLNENPRKKIIAPSKDLWDHFFIPSDPNWISIS